MRSRGSAAMPAASTIAHPSKRAPDGMTTRSPTTQSVSRAPAPIVTSSHRAERSTTAVFAIETRAPFSSRFPSAAANARDVSRQSRGVPMSWNDAGQTNAATLPGRLAIIRGYTSPTDSAGTPSSRSANTSGSTTCTPMKWNDSTPIPGRVKP